MPSPGLSSPLNNEQVVLGDACRTLQPWRSVSLFGQQLRNPCGRQGWGGWSGQQAGPPQGEGAKVEEDREGFGCREKGRGRGRRRHRRRRDRGWRGDRPSPELPVVSCCQALNPSTFPQTFRLPGARSPAACLPATEVRAPPALSVPSLVPGSHLPFVYRGGDAACGGLPDQGQDV